MLIETISSYTESHWKFDCFVASSFVTLRRFRSPISRTPQIVYINHWVISDTRFDCLLYEVVREKGKSINDDWKRVTETFANSDSILISLLHAHYLVSDDRSPMRNLPVIVFLHGESFEWNSGNAYDGSILASYGQVIVITLNYRLGALGKLRFRSMKWLQMKWWWNDCFRVKGNKWHFWQATSRAFKHFKSSIKLSLHLSSLYLFRRINLSFHFISRHWPSPILFHSGKTNKRKKGFLKPGLNDQTVANFGLLDIIAALQWIKENIEQFGGDRNSVTLLGYDTGAICANFLMISPIASGLFHRAILMSGSALSDWALNYNPQQITMQVAKRLNCPIEDSQLGECLRAKSYQEILNITVTAPEFLTIFGPIVDGLVVPSDPHQVMADSDSFSRFDLLFGMTEIESYNILGRDAIQEGLPQIERDHNIRRYLVNRFDKRPEVAFLSTLKEYTNTFMKPKPVSSLDHRDMLLEILSDARVTAPLSKLNFYWF